MPAATDTRPGSSDSADWTAATAAGEPGAVMTDTRPAGSDEPETTDAAARRWGPARVLIALVVLGLVAMWAYVLYLAIGPGRQPPIDRLDDPAFARAGEERCAEALDAVDALPVASESATATERADVLAQADAVFATMLDDLEANLDLAPAGDQRDRAAEWLADWHTYLGDREAFAEALRTDPGARLLVSEKEGEGRQVTGWIDEFANANRMPSCITPTDA
jgi:hypothetical protein